MTPEEKVAYQEYATAKAEAEGVPVDLITGILDRESGFNPNPPGSNDQGNAKGIAQIWGRWHPYRIPGDPSSGALDPSDPYQSIDYLVAYVKMLIDKHGGNVKAALPEIDGQWHTAHLVPGYALDSSKKSPSVPVPGSEPVDPTTGEPLGPLPTGPTPEGPTGPTPDHPPAGWTLEKGTKGEPIWRNTNSGLAYDPNTKMVEQPDGNWKYWDGRGAGGWVKDPTRVPIPGNYLGVDSTQRTGLDLTGMAGPPAPMRPLGQVPIPEMTGAEQYHYYPWGDAAQGGDQQATYDVLSGMGYSPNSGNPWMHSLSDLVAPLAHQIAMKLTLGGFFDPTAGATNRGQIAGSVSDLLKAGRTSSFDDPTAFLRQLRDFSGEYRNPVNSAAMNPDQLGLGLSLNEPSGSGAINAIVNAIGPNSNPYTRQYLAPALQRRLMQYRADAPGAGNQSPLEYLLSYIT